MSSEETRAIHQSLLDLAIQQTAALLLILPACDTKFVIRELFFQVWNKFREHDQTLVSLHILEIADWEFVVRANVHCSGNLLIERKEGKNA